MIPTASNNSVYWSLSELHSDGAPNSYMTGTSMKDTYRPDDVDARGIPCCRPESFYHPDRLWTCLQCHSLTGRHHQPCPHVLYGPPDKPLVERPYTGPPLAVNEVSSYRVIPHTYLLTYLTLTL